MEKFYNIKLKINKEQNNLRLDQALAKLSNYTRSQIKILLLNGNVKKNQEIINETSYRVKIGEEYLLSIKVIKEETFDKIVYLMNISDTKFRKPVFPGDEIYAYVSASRSRGRVWKFNGIAKDIENKTIAESTWSATIMDKT